MFLSSIAGRTRPVRFAAFFRTLTLALLIGIALTCARASQAQLLARPSVRITLGAIPSPDGDIRRHVGSPFPLGIAEISIPQLFGAGNYLGIGYGERRRDGNSLRVIPITLTRLYTPNLVTNRITGYPYGGAGFALYLLRGRTNGGAGESDETDENTAYGFTTIVGYQLPNAVFVEARYNAVTGSARGMNPGGLWLMAGLKL